MLTRPFFHSFAYQTNSYLTLFLLLNIDFLSYDELINFILFFSSNGSTSVGGGGGNGSAGGGEGVGGDSGAHIDEEEWDNIDPLVDNGEPGVKVRALYDYEAAEEDELDFKAGNSIKALL